LLNNQGIFTLGYVYVWSNDSGSGFEYTATLYPGRNGGPYLIREWKAHKEIARAAGENVLRYYRLLRDAASEINPGFRIISTLGSFPVEEETILKGLNNRLDLSVPISDTKNQERWKKIKTLRNKGSYIFTNVDLTSNYILGVPFPWLAYERLGEVISSGIERASVRVNPPSLAPCDINRTVVKEFRLNPQIKIDEIITTFAEKLGEKKHAGTLVQAWKYSDEAVRNFPDVSLYNTFGFAWYRIWSRPFVPDIDKIPENERAYYEKYMITTFNNPTRIDMSKDILWDLIPVDMAEDIVGTCDAKVFGSLQKGIEILGQTAENLTHTDRAHNIFIDQRDRLIARKCYYRSLRNMCAWIAEVHGYIKARNDNERKEKLTYVRDMISNELANIRELLKLWQNSKVTFMPVYEPGETNFTYGANFGEVLEKKIHLMEKHKNDFPYIDPNYMWRMPPDFKVNMAEYLKY